MKFQVSIKIVRGILEKRQKEFERTQHRHEIFKRLRSIEDVPAAMPQHTVKRQHTRAADVSNASSAMPQKQQKHVAQTVPRRSTRQRTVTATAVSTALSSVPQLQQQKDEAQTVPRRITRQRTHTAVSTALSSVPQQHQQKTSLPTIRRSPRFQ